MWPAPNCHYLTRQVFELAIFLSPQKPTAGAEKSEYNIGSHFQAAKVQEGPTSRAGRLRPATPAAAAGSGGGMHRTRFQKERKKSRNRISRISLSPNRLRRTRKPVAHCSVYKDPPLWFLQRLWYLQSARYA